MALAPKTRSDSARPMTLADNAWLRFGFLIGAVAWFAEPQGMLWLMIGTLAVAGAVLPVARYPAVRISDP